MLTHVNQENKPQMVNIIEKVETQRSASAFCKVLIPSDVFKLLETKNDEIISKKGPVFSTAIIAATMAVKKTSEIIPFCHLISIEGCSIDIKIEKRTEIHIMCKVDTFSRTGVEMEAMLGAQIAALTIYDMCKAVSHEIQITELKLISKRGGKSDYN